CCMILFWCLCACLVFGGLLARRPVRTALEELRLHLFGVRVRVPREQSLPAPHRPGPNPSGGEYWPAHRVVTRAGPRRGPGDRATRWRTTPRPPVPLASEQGPCWFSVVVARPLVRAGTPGQRRQRAAT